MDKCKIIKSLVWVLGIGLFIVLPMKIEPIISEYLSIGNTNNDGPDLAVAHLTMLIVIVPLVLISRLIMGYKTFPTALISKKHSEYMIAVGGSVLLFLISQLHKKVTNGENEEWAINIVSENPAFIVLVTVGLIAPIIEEIIFRGIGYYLTLRISNQPLIAVILPAIFFTLIHVSQYSITGLVYIFSLACWFGYLRWKTSSISIPIVAHATSGLIAFVWLRFL